MKSFFEEYGFVILAAIVVILLIAMCTPIGNLVKSQITGIVDSFANKTNTKLNAVDAGENTAYLRYNSGSTGLELDVASANSTDTFLYKLHYTQGGQSKDDVYWRALDKTTSVEGIASDDIKEDAKAGATSGTMKIAYTNMDNSTTLQVEVKNVGTGEIFYSNSITIKK